MEQSTSVQSETGTENNVVIVHDPAQLVVPGLESQLTSEVILDLLRIPQAGFVRISAALFFLGREELFAFYWRDEYSHREHCKFIAADAVRAAFNGVPFDSGWLARDMLRTGVTSQGEHWFVTFFPARIYELAIEDHERGQLSVQVALPGLVFAGRNRSYWTWVIKDPYPSAESQVFHAPLSNVAADGNICFGGNALPVAEAISMPAAFHVFLTSPFNGHSSSGKSRSFPGDVRYLLLELANHAALRFPEEELLPMQTANDPERKLSLNFIVSYVLGKG